MPAEAGDWPTAIEAVFRNDRSRVLATLIRLLGGFDLAEEALHDAFSAALEQWPVKGMPDSPWRWLVSVGRFRTIDRLRQKSRLAAVEADLVRQFEDRAEATESEDITDDSLRLIFTCCHPSLPPDGQVALTLREVCGLTTEEISAAFLVTPSTVAQRIVRAKARIRDAAIPYEVPTQSELPERLEEVLRVVYLVFNEGYAAHRGDAPLRPELSGEAIRLARLIADLVPDPEAIGLLALLLFQESRQGARLDVAGDVILMEDQDRGLWDRGKIAEASALLDGVLAGREYGAYTLQAAIAAEHVRPADVAGTNWPRVVELYDLLMLADPSPVVELNRAAAIGLSVGPEAGIELIDGLLGRGQLTRYHLAHTATAELQRRAGRFDAAAGSYRIALQLASEAPDRRLLERRLAEVEAGPDQGVASSAVISSTSDS